MNKKNRKSEDAGILSWIINVILLSVIPPVGIFLLIARFIGKDFLGSLIATILSSTGDAAGPDATRASTHRTVQHYESNSSSRSRAAQSGRTVAGPGQVDWERVRASQNGGAAQQPNQNAAARPTPNTAAQRPGAAQNPNASAKKEKPDDGIAHISTGKKALFIFGWILIAAGVVGGVGALGTTLWRVLKFIAVILGGGAMLYTAHTKDKKERLYQNCVKIVGNKPVIDLNSLARAAGVKPKKLERELDEMLERGYFPAAAYYDNEHDVLILDPEKAQSEAARSVQKTAPTDDHKQDKFDLLMQELDRACGRIQDRDMLEKSVQIRGLTAAIFHAVREDPEKEQQISNFVNYYFPTTLKLLDSYADFEEKGYQGEKLTQTKDRIESTADTIIAAYQKQLDNLYLTDTLDVDTDIDVLETMLKRDGLSESDFGQTGTPGL